MGKLIEFTVVLILLVAFLWGVIQITKSSKKK